MKEDFSYGIMLVGEEGKSITIIHDFRQKKSKDIRNKELDQGAALFKETKKGRGEMLHANHARTI